MGKSSTGYVGMDVQKDSHERCARCRRRSDARDLACRGHRAHIVLIDRRHVRPRRVARGRHVNRIRCVACKRCLGRRELDLADIAELHPLLRLP
jgi:hypothetical protein